LDNRRLYEQSSSACIAAQVYGLTVAGRGFGIRRLRDLQGAIQDLHGLPLRIAMGAKMTKTYTLRYTNEAGHMIRMLMIQCKDDQHALQRAVSTMPSPYATLMVSVANKLVWRGTRAKATEWASAPGPLPSYTARVS